MKETSSPIEEEEVTSNDEHSPLLDEPQSPEPESKAAEDREKVISDLKKTRSGGAYIPPGRLALMQRSVPQDPHSEAYQRMTWDALKKALHGHVNKVNVSNLKDIVVALFKLNVVRGRALLARSLIKAQSASLPFTPVYAALVAVLNCKLPLVGELILTRLINQFRKSFRRNDKPQCLACTIFIAHLVNQYVAHEILALEMLALFLENPTDDSVEMAVGFVRECGAKLMDLSPTAFNGIFERFRHILHEGQIDKRVQYMIEVLFHVRKNNFKENVSVKEELDLIEEEDRVTHCISLDDELDPKDELLVFHYDPRYEENEAKYSRIKAEILGDESDEEGDEDDEDEDDDDEAEREPSALDLKAQMEIQDRTNTNLINLRKTIYLAIMSSLDFEECAHKLLKMKIAEGQEIELCNMVVECCSQERTFAKFYGLLAERFCKLSRGGRLWSEKFLTCWQETYDSIHRYETNRIRNIGKLFAFLLSADAISWRAFEHVNLTEEETTSASRILLKFVFKELMEILGLSKLREKLLEPSLAESMQGIFPRDNLRDTRFAINYFTSIGLGGVTDELREFLAESMKNDPRTIAGGNEGDESAESEEEEQMEEEDKTVAHAVHNIRQQYERRRDDDDNENRSVRRREDEDSRPGRQERSPSPYSRRERQNDKRDERRPEMARKKSLSPYRTERRDQPAQREVRERSLSPYSKRVQREEGHRRNDRRDERRDSPPPPPTRRARHDSPERGRSSSNNDQKRGSEELSPYSQRVRMSEQHQQQREAIDTRHRGARSRSSSRGHSQSRKRSRAADDERRRPVRRGRSRSRSLSSRSSSGSSSSSPIRSTRSKR